MTSNERQLSYQLNCAGLRSADVAGMWAELDFRGPPELMLKCSTKLVFGVKEMNLNSENE